MKVFAENFRGFKQIEIDLSKINFLVGDNSSGKSSILHLVDCILRNDLTGPPRLNDDLGVGAYDYFSPYFDNADVSFGFTATSDDKEFSKIITVSKTGADPYVKSCSYISDTMAITLKRSGGSIKIRVNKNPAFVDYSDKIKLHHNKSGFSSGKKLPPSASVSEPGIVFAFVSLEDVKDESFLSVIFGEAMPSARLISPLRALPEKFYTLKRTLNSRGSHFAAMWLDLSKVSAKDTLSDVEKFGAESGLFETIKIKRLVSNVSDSPLVASVVKSEREFFLNQVGVGVSQVVPILVETMFSVVSKTHRRMPILIQQPELHLHPVAQAALGSFFYKASSKGVRGILETHSSFLIDRFRAEIRDSVKGQGSNISCDDALIIFCENSTEGNKATAVNILADGQLGNEPESYHEFFIAEHRPD